MVIGDEIREKLFPREDAIGKRVTLGHDGYVVIGVFEKKGKMFGESQDNFVVIPITTFDRRFPWVKAGASDGDALRIATVPYTPGAGPRDHRKGDVDSPHAPARPLRQAQRLRNRDSGQDDRELPGNHERDHAGDGVHRLHLAPDRRSGSHEHHAGLGDRADAGDRRPEGRGRVPARHHPAVPDGGDDALRDRRSDRGRGRDRDTGRRSRRRSTRSRRRPLCGPWWWASWCRSRSGSFSGSTPRSRPRGSIRSKRSGTSRSQLQSVWIAGGFVRVCMTTQYCSVFSLSARS